MASLLEIVKTVYKKLQGASGKSINANCKGLGNKTFDCELYSVPGIFGKPQSGVMGVEINLGGIRIIIASHNYKLNKTLDDGETLIYSIDEDGVLKAQALFDKDGKIILNEGTDFAVKFNELKTAFDELKSNYNDFITTKYNLHMHPTAVVGPPSLPTLTGISSTADMSNAKVEYVLL